MSSRSVGMTPGPIWWSTVQAYCDAKKLDEEQTFAMHYHIQQMDALYLKKVVKK